MTDAEAQENDRPWQVAVDRAVCIGSAMCVGIAPDRFRLAGRRSSAVAPRIEPEEAVLDAGENCPVEAIRVRDVRTGEVLAPRGSAPGR